jgi:hypothetical protein
MLKRSSKNGAAYYVSRNMLGFIFTTPFSIILCLNGSAVIFSSVLISPKDSNHYGLERPLRLSRGSMEGSLPRKRL